MNNFLRRKNKGTKKRVNNHSLFFVYQKIAPFVIFLTKSTARASRRRFAQRHGIRASKFGENDERKNYKIS